MNFFKENLISLVNGGSCLNIEANQVIFSENEVYQIVDGIPVVINDSDGLFSLKDIIVNAATTQSAEHLDSKKLKNFVRKKVLPSLTRDKYFNERYAWLGQNITGNILVLGAGDKINYYKNLFPTCQVITSDVHRQFGPDIIFDAHHIPFKDNVFHLVIAGQVLEHTMQPWVVANEIQRVLKPMGLAHIETPVNFPYHAHPYDFYRFTYTGLRSLFHKCNVQKSFVTEGNASSVAVMNSDFLISLFKQKFLRKLSLFVARILFGWIKYLDKDSKDNINSVRRLAIPKGIGFTFQFDNIKRSPKDLLLEYYEILNKS